MKTSKVPLYGATMVMVADRKKMLRLAKQRDASSLVAMAEDEDVSGLVAEDGNGNTILFVDVQSEQRRPVATLAHEAVHAANIILASAGVVTDQQNDEAHAYLVTWIVEQFMETFYDRA